MKTERFEMRIDKKTLENVRTRADKYKMSVAEFFIFCAENAEVAVTIGTDRLYDEVEGLEAFATWRIFDERAI